MLRRSFHQEAVDNHRGQRQVDQDIPQGLAAFRGNFLSPVQRKSQSAQQEHLQDLPHKNQHDFHIISLLTSCIPEQKDESTPFRNKGTVLLVRSAFSACWQLFQPEIISSGSNYQNRP